MNIHFKSILLCIGLLVLTACQSTSTPHQKALAKPHEIAALFDQTTPEYKSYRAEKKIKEDIHSSICLLYTSPSPRDS